MACCADLVFVSRQKGNEDMYIVALNGSHNKDGNTAFLLSEVLQHCAQAGAQTELISVHEAVMDAKTPFCVNCTTPCAKVCYQGTKLEEAFEKVAKADFVLFGSPVYFGSMTAQMKAFFDKTRAVRADKAWLGKPMAAVAVGASKYGGQEHTIEHIQACAFVSGMTVLGNSSGLSMGHFGLAAQKPACEDAYALKEAKSLATRIIDTIK